MGQINLSDLFHHGSHRHCFFFAVIVTPIAKYILGQFPSDHTFVVFQEKVAGFPQFNDNFDHLDFVSIISLHARESNSELYWLY